MPCRILSLGLILLYGGVMPLSAELNPNSIQAAQSYSASHGGVGMIVQQGGKTILEKYYNGHTQDTPMHIFSGTKSFFGVLAAIAVDEGLFKWDDHVADTITEWKTVSSKSKITVRQLLDFTSGLETGFEEIYGKAGVNKLKVAIALDSKRTPDSSFIYGPSHLQVFGEFLNRKLKSRSQDYQAYLQTKLLGPLGITYTKWREDEAGNPHLSAGMHMTSHNWLKFGQFLLQDGVWNGTRLVSAENLAECFQGTGPNPAFGCCFWLNSYQGRLGARVVDVEEWLEIRPLPENWQRACLCKDAPPDLIASLGSNFQRLYLVPSQQLIVLHQGKNGKFRDEEFLKLLFQP